MCSPWGSHSRDKARKKLVQKAKDWSCSDLSLLYAVKVYNTYILPTASFVAQLEEVPNDIGKIEAKVFRCLVKGPARWAPYGFFGTLNRGFGFPVEARNLQATARAAKLRMMTEENRGQGGLAVEERVRNLEKGKEQGLFKP